MNLLFIIYNLVKFYIHKKTYENPSSGGTVLPQKKIF